MEINIKCELPFTWCKECQAMELIKGFRPGDRKMKPTQICKNAAICGELIRAKKKKICEAIGNGSVMEEDERTIAVTLFAVRPECCEFPTKEDRIAEIERQFRIGLGNVISEMKQTTKRDES